MNAALEASPVRNRLLLIGAALLFSTGGAAIKAATLTGWQVASFRSGVAAVVLLAVLPEARRGWSWRLVPVGAAYAATLVLFVLATRLTTAANAIFLQSTAPLYLLLLGPWLLREPVRRSDLVYVLAVAGGMALLFLGTEQALATAPDPHRGNLLGVASGLAWALTVTGLRWLGRSGEGNRCVGSGSRRKPSGISGRASHGIAHSQNFGRRRGRDPLPGNCADRLGLRFGDARHPACAGVRSHHGAPVGTRHESDLGLDGAVGETRSLGPGRRRRHFVRYAGEHVAPGAPLRGCSL